MPKIEVYSTGYCPYCVSAKNLLKSKGLEWTEVMVDTDPARRDEMLQRSGGRRTVPSRRPSCGCRFDPSRTMRSGMDRMLPLVESAWQRPKTHHANRPSAKQLRDKREMRPIPHPHPRRRCEMVT